MLKNDFQGTIKLSKKSSASKRKSYLQHIQNLTFTRPAEAKPTFVCIDFEPILPGRYSRMRVKNPIETMSPSCTEGRLRRTGASPLKKNVDVRRENDGTKKTAREVETENSDSDRRYFSYLKI
jgi:hypothetical protein